MQLALCCDEDEWRPVPEFPMYEVNAAGQVRRDGSIRSAPRPKRSTGYVEITLHANNKRHCRLLHRLIASAFFGPIPRGHEVHHRDGDRTNNALANLEVLGAEAHARRRHACTRGEAVWCAKLTSEKAAEIRQRRAAGELQKDLAVEYGVARSTITRVTSGRYWAAA